MDGESAQTMVAELADGMASPKDLVLVEAMAPQMERAMAHKWEEQTGETMASKWVGESAWQWEWRWEGLMMARTKASESDPEWAVH